MTILIFCGKLIVTTGLLFGYYYYFLRNKRFHHYNRFYLLAVTLFSLIIPFLNIPVNLFSGGHQPSTFIQTLKVINANGWEEPVIIYARSNQWSKWINLQNGLYFVYVAGLATGLIILFRSLVYIKGLRKKYHHKKIDQLKIYDTTEPGTPFSFFKSIFWDKKISLDDKYGQQIFRHEMFHVKEKHSADILFLELLCCCFWFNPFFHLIKKEIKAIHEFLADEYAISCNNQYDYAELLLTHAISQKTAKLTHPFFHNQIKRRITMITQSNLRRNGYISRIMALPVLFLLVSAFAIKLNHKTPASAGAYYAAKNITVVIDAGHGGSIEGTRGLNGVAEKDINLSIAKQIKELSNEYNVSVVLTRDKDEMAGNAVSLKEDLQNRLKITNDAKADIFVSVHVNATPGKNTTESGFIAYVTRKKENKKALILSSAILTELKQIYPVNETIKQRETGVVVLDQNTCPSVLIECGYLNNPKDAAFITNAANQEKVARKILEGIVKYRNSQLKETTQAQEKVIADTAVMSGTKDKEKFIEAANKQLEKAISENENGNPYKKVLQALTKTIGYPGIAKSNLKQGEVFVRFDGINDKGNIENPELLTTDEYGLSADVFNALQKIKIENFAEHSRNRSGARVIKVKFFLEKNSQRLAFENCVAIKTTATGKIMPDMEIVVLGIAGNKMEPPVAELQNSISFTNTDTIPGSKADKRIIFTKVEIEPDYPGGQQKWIDYLVKHVKYPDNAVKKNIQGTVVVQFIVDISGKISDVKALSGPEELRAESIRVIKESGLWSSALQNGKKVKAYKKQPITYKLSA